jgi:hypothetical protein
MYVLFFIELERRLVWLGGVSPHPTGVWATQQARNLARALAQRATRMRFCSFSRYGRYRGARDGGQFQI